MQELESIVRDSKKSSEIRKMAIILLAELEEQKRVEQERVEWDRKRAEWARQAKEEREERENRKAPIKLSNGNDYTLLTNHNDLRGTSVLKNVIDYCGGVDQVYDELRETVSAKHVISDWYNGRTPQHFHAKNLWCVLKKKRVSELKKATEGK